ncbi:hypothetical protein DdX_20451 [Ditylenchus destructor]|uniref:Uncharacterized protein n=1 Tax=Ditylenchus destructor TaxID=166010 RepID=A0AAD4QWC6_9BILA|nr:hypothetical protein DdX_20451 [Ditylenchus destructor]
MPSANRPSAAGGGIEAGLPPDELEGAPPDELDVPPLDDPSGVEGGGVSIANRGRGRQRRGRGDRRKTDVESRHRDSPSHFGREGQQESCQKRRCAGFSASPWLIATARRW